MASRVSDISDLTPVARRGNAYNIGECNAAAQSVKEHVQDPALQLGVPPDIALTMILCYTRNLDPRGRYKGCLHSLRSAGRYEALRQKLSTDEALVIPAIFSHEEAALRARSKVAAAAHLEELDSQCVSGTFGAVPPYYMTFDSRYLSGRHSRIGEIIDYETEVEIRNEEPVVQTPEGVCHRGGTKSGHATQHRQVSSLRRLVAVSLRGSSRTDSRDRSRGSIAVITIDRP